MIDPKLAFSRAYAGFSIWETPDGQFQCNLRRRGESSAFTIGIGATPEAAWVAAMPVGQVPQKPRREVDDLA